MQNSATTAALAACPLFSGLSPEEFENLARRAQPGSTARYQFIYMPDERADGFYLLLSGAVKLGYFRADGKDVVKEVLKPGAVFGESSLLDSGLRVDFAQAQHEAAEWLHIQAADFHQIMRENFELTRSLLRFVNRQLGAVEERLNSLIVKDARSRIIHFLAQKAGREGRKFGGETLVKHHLTQQDIASLTGTSRQTVTSVLNELKKNNLLHFTRTSFLIRDLDSFA